MEKTENLEHKTKELYSHDTDIGLIEKYLKKGKRTVVAAAMLPLVLMPSYSHAAAHAVVSFKGNSMAVAAATSPETQDSVTLSWYNDGGCDDFSVYRKRLDDNDWTLISSYSQSMIVDTVYANSDFEYKIVPNSDGNECSAYVFRLKKSDGKVYLQWTTEPPKNLRFVIE